jgi:hypothetical protein
MTTADSTNTMSIAFNVEALRHRTLAAEADINALAAVRTDADVVRRTEATHRGLIAKQDRYRRLARRTALCGTVAGLIAGTFAAPGIAADPADTRA